jgi:hypothetical protein
MFNQNAFCNSLFKEFFYNNNYIRNIFIEQNEYNYISYKIIYIILKYKHKKQYLHLLNNNFIFLPQY